MRVLVLGGTGEARALAAELVARGLDVITSLAGQVARPLLPAGRVRIGPFVDDDQLAAYLRDEDIDCVVDATHPFAAAITRHAVDVCGRENIPIVVLRRPPWSARPDDRWIRVRDLLDAVRLVRRWPQDGAILLTTGRGGLAAFADDVDHGFVVRSIDPPQGQLPPRATILLQRGPFDVQSELALMREHHVSLLVTKDSGGDATAAKLIAARRLSLSVVVIERPVLPDVAVVEGVQAAVQWVDERCGIRR